MAAWPQGRKSGGVGLPGDEDHKDRCWETLATAGQRATALTCRVRHIQKTLEGSNMCLKN